MSRDGPKLSFVIAQRSSAINRQADVRCERARSQVMTLSGHRRFTMLRRNDQAKHARAANAAPRCRTAAFHRHRGLQILELTERRRAAAGPTPTAALLAAIGARAERVARRGTARHPRSPGTPIRGL